MNPLKKFFLYVSIGVVILFTATIISVFLFKDRIIQQFVAEANKSLNTPVKIAKIDISFWSDFPNLSILFHDVYIEDSHTGEYPLFIAEKVSFTFNAKEAWNGKYSVRGLTVDNGYVYLKVDRKGRNNFTIVNPSKNATSQAISFHLKNVQLLNTSFSYHDLASSQHHILSGKKLLSSISLHNNNYTIDVSGDIAVSQIKVKNQLFLENKPLRIQTQLTYDDIKKTIHVSSGKLAIHASQFSVAGHFSFKNQKHIKLNVDATEATIKTFLALLPNQLTSPLHNYQSEGNLFFNLLLEGEISKTNDPALHILFGCKNATFLEPTSNSKITDTYISGKIFTPSLTHFEKLDIYLEEIQGQLNGKSFTSRLILKNPVDPYLEFNFKGEIEAQSLQTFYPIPLVKNTKGDLLADFSIVGKVALLKQKATAHQVDTKGNIRLSNVFFELAKNNLDFRNIDGLLEFNTNDLTISNLSGYIGKSDFILTGFFKNIIPALVLKNEAIGIEANLKSNQLDLDQLLNLKFSSADSSANQKIQIPSDIYLRFNCDVKKLSYKKFHPQHVKGDLLLKNQTATMRNVAMKTMGGIIQSNGTIDFKDPNHINVVSFFKLEGIHLDSLFYVFENFSQSFIEDRHLKGQAYAGINMEMSLNQNLQLLKPSLLANINAIIKKGELNQFKPLQALNKYLDDETLNQLRFADLKNEIHIENQTVYIPEMEIKSNVTSLHLNGTHTFDQQINYRIATPLRSKKKIDPDEAFGAIEENTKGQTTLYLKITGTTHRYKVSYDKEAVKKKIVSSFKKEVNELKEAFQQKGIKKKKEIELEKNEYFDLDN